MKLTGKTIAGYGLAKLAPGVVTLLGVPIMVHQIGVAGYGIYSSTWALTLFAVSLSGGWMRSAALRATGDRTRAIELLPRSVLVLVSIAPALPVAGWTWSVTSRHPELGSAALVGAGAMFAIVSGGYTLIATRTQRDGAATRYAMAETVRAAIGLGLSICLVVADAASGATAALVSYGIATVFAGTIAAGHGLPTVRRAAKPAGLLTAYWRYGWPISLWLTASTGLVYADRFVITLLLGPTVAGRYSAVADVVVRGTAMVASPIIMAAHPAVMARWNAGHLRQAVSLIRRTSQALIILLVAGVAGIVAVGPMLLDFALPGSATSRSVLGGLAFGSAMWQLGLMSHKPFELVARNKEMLALAAGAMTSVIMLDVVLVPIVGLVGAVVALCVGATGYTISCAVFGARILRTCLASQSSTTALRSAAVRGA